MDDKPQTGRDLPITLPSLYVASVCVPVPMTRDDYDYFLAYIQSFEEALVVEDNPTMHPKDYIEKVSKKEHWRTQ